MAAETGVRKQKVTEAVRDVVAKQKELGIDIVSDGEQGKLGFYSYVRERLSGFELAEREPMEIMMGRSKEVRAFPEYYQRYFAKRSGPRIGESSTPVKCTAPITYQGMDRRARKKSSSPLLPRPVR